MQFHKTDSCHFANSDDTIERWRTFTVDLFTAVQILWPTSPEWKKYALPEDVKVPDEIALAAPQYRLERTALDELLPDFYEAVVGRLCIARWGITPSWVPEAEAAIVEPVIVPDSVKREFDLLTERVPRAQVPPPTGSGVGSAHVGQQAAPGSGVGSAHVGREVAAPASFPGASVRDLEGRPLAPVQGRPDSALNMEASCPLERKPIFSMPAGAIPKWEAGDTVVVLGPYNSGTNSMVAALQDNFHVNVQPSKRGSGEIKIGNKKPGNTTCQ